MFCPKCGKELKEGDVFCPACGNKVEQEEKTYQDANKLYSIGEYESAIDKFKSVVTYKDSAKGIAGFTKASYKFASTLSSGEEMKLITFWI